MFTRASTPQVRRFTRLSASLFGAPRREGRLRALPKGKRETKGDVESLARARRVAGRNE